MRISRSTATALAATLPVVLAQTSTDCNPLEKTCPDDVGLDAEAFSSDFTQGSSAGASWTAADGTTITYGSQGAEFIMSSAADAPTLSSSFYFLFGRVDVKVKASPGTGIVSSIVLESDDLDEIDWEWLGGDTTQVQTNFFGKGNTTSYDRGTYQSVASPQTEFHTYSYLWTADSLQWIIDGTTVRTLNYDDPLALGGKNYPQTPMRVKLGSWCGGCSSSEGTVTWAGGKTSFDDAPYVMYVDSVAITNYNPAESYVYGDMTGDWQSIQINKGDNTTSAGSSTTSGSAAATTATATTASAVGSATNTAASTATVAATSAIAVSNLQNSNVVQATTVVASASGTAAVSTSAETTGTTLATSAVSTGVPGSSSTSTSGSGSNTSVTSSGPSAATHTNAAATSTQNTIAASLLISVALAFFFM